MDLRMSDWKGRKVLVLGLGDTGLSMTRWLARHGAQVRVADSRDAPPHAGALRDALPDAVLATGAFDTSGSRRSTPGLIAMTSAASNTAC